MPQCHNIADIHAITIMYGNTPNAKVSRRDIYGVDKSLGGYPKTNFAPSTVASWRTTTPFPSASKALITNGTSRRIAANII